MLKRKKIVCAIFFLMLLLILATITLIFISHYRSQKFEFLTFGDCISYEFVATSGDRSGSVSTLVYRLNAMGFNAGTDSANDIGARVGRVSIPQNQMITPLFSIIFYKPDLVAVQGENVYDGQGIEVLVSLVNDESKMDSSLIPATIVYDDKRLLLTIDKWAYEVNNSHAFTTLFDLTSQDILLRSNVGRFFPWK